MIRIVRRKRTLAEWAVTKSTGSIETSPEVTRKTTEIKKYWQVYLNDETAFGLVNSLTTLVCGPGFDIEGEGDTEEVRSAFVRSWSDINSLVRNALIFGNGFAEIVYTRSGKFHSLESIYPLDIEIEQEGNEIRYIHTDSQKTFGPDKIFNLVFFPREDSLYGLPLLQPLYNAILRKQQLEEALITAVERHLPRLHITLKRDDLGHYPSEEERRAIARMFRDLKPEYEIVTTDLVDIEALDVKGVPNIGEYLEFMLNAIALGAQTPIEVLGPAARGSTHATARIRANIFFAGPVAFLQRTLENSINSQILKDSKVAFRIKKWEMPLAYTGK